MRDGWRRRRLGEALALDVDRVPVEAGGKYELAGVFSFGRGLFHREPLLAEKTSYRHLNALHTDRFVMSKLKGWEGAVTVIGSEFEGTVLSPEFPTYHVNADLLLPGYLRLLTTHRPFWELLATQSTGMGGRKERVHHKRVLDVELDLPPVAAQLRIIDVIEAVASAVTSAEGLAAASHQAGDQMRDTLFSDLISTTHSALSERVEVTNGRQRSPKHATGDHMLRYVRAANVKDGQLILDEPMYMNFTPKEQERYRLEVGDVLVTEGCGSLAQIGASCLWNGELPGTVCFQNHLLRLRTRDPERLAQRFVYQWALWAFRSGRFAEVAMGTNIFSLGTQRVSNLPFPTVDLETQLQVVELLDAAVEAAAAADQTVDALRAARSSLLDDLLSGDHEIPTSYDELLNRAS